jgi:hypothetical protein
MSQSILIKRETQPKTPNLLSLNMPNVDVLFPGFAPGDFAVIYGSPSTDSLTSLLCVRAQLPSKLGGLNSNVVFIDGGDTFRTNKFFRFAKLQHVALKQALDNIHVFRVFTAYQMTQLIMERLQNIVEKYDAKVVVISDIAGLFLDRNIPDDEARRVFSQVVAYLQSFACRNQIILIATNSKVNSSSRSISLKTAIISKANVVLSLWQTMYDREFVLEKHPQLMLGSAEYPSENLPLTNFV